MSKQDGGPAFPGWEYFIAMREDSKGPVRVITGQPHGGLTVRDYFAAKALSVIDAASLKALHAQAESERCDPSILLARFVYELADAMLEAR